MENQGYKITLLSEFIINMTGEKMSAAVTTAPGQHFKRNFKTHIKFKQLRKDDMAENVVMIVSFLSDF